MDCVWELGEATVREVHGKLQAVKPRAYNTVLTIMRILREKGFLESERRGRADLYRPTVAREQMGERRLRELLERFFAGSAHALVSRLIEAEDLDAEEIEAIRRELDEQLRDGA
jgi:predicted transcriptional regulator